MENHFRGWFFNVELDLDSNPDKIIHNNGITPYSQCFIATDHPACTDARLSPHTFHHKMKAMSTGAITY
jgi:hypothetical protein